MNLLHLPTELLMLIHSHLHNIEDFTNLSSTCRTLHEALLSTSPNTILRLAAAQSNIFFRPHPHFLVAATARQVSEWALRSETNYEELRNAFHGGGMGKLFELCVAKCGITMHDIRRLHLARFSTINPAADIIDRCAGQQFYDQDPPEFASIDVEPEEALFQIIIYGELFGSTMDAILDLPGSGNRRFDLEMRLDFINYCIPSWKCRCEHDAGTDTSIPVHTSPFGRPNRCGIVPWASREIVIAPRTPVPI